MNPANDTPYGPPTTFEDDLPPPPRRRPRKREALGAVFLLAPTTAPTWNGEKVGQEREKALARKDGRPADMARAHCVPPWEWTAPEMDALGPNVVSGVEQ